MRAFVALAVVALALALVGYVDGRRDRHADERTGTPVSYTAKPAERHGATALERLERAIEMKPGTRKPLGSFTLASGRRVQLYTAETDDAKSCLLEDDSGAGAGAGCLEDGLFGARRVAFSVNTDGGPARFAELYVVGVVAPSVRSAALVLTDGREVPLRLAANRTFLFESPEADLASGVHPTGFRLFGAAGKLVETVSFPSAAS